MSSPSPLPTTENIILDDVKPSSSTPTNTTAETTTVTISKAEYELLQSNASQAVISTLRVIKRFNAINDSLVNMIAWVANLREETFRDLNLPESTSSKPT